MVRGAGHARPGLRRRRVPRLLPSPTGSGPERSRRPSSVPASYLWAGVQLTAVRPDALPPRHLRARSEPRCVSLSTRGNPSLGWGRGGAFGAELMAWPPGPISAVSGGAGLTDLRGRTWTPWRRARGGTRGPCSILIHFCSVLPPHRCLATAAVENKGCLSREGEGRGAAPRPAPGSLPSPHCGTGSLGSGRGRSGWAPTRVRSSSAVLG